MLDLLTLLVISQSQPTFSQRISDLLVDLDRRRNNQELVEPGYISSYLGVVPKCWGNSAEKACNWTKGNHYVTIRWRFSRINNKWLLSTFDRSL